MQAVVLKMMETVGAYDPETDAQPDGAAQKAFLEEYVETVLLSNVKGYYKRQRVATASADDPADEL